MIQIQITDTFLMQQNIQLENKWTRNISPICLTFLLWEKRVLWVLWEGGGYMPITFSSVGAY